MRELKRLFRVLIDSPGRIGEGPDWVRQKLQIWRMRRRGPSGHVAASSARFQLERRRLRYDQLRVLVRDDAASFPETSPEVLPSPDEGIDLVFTKDGEVPASLLTRVETADGFVCRDLRDSWECTSADGRRMVTVQRRNAVDLSEFNPVGRRVDTALFAELDDSGKLDPEELRKLAAVRVPMSLAETDQVSAALQALACGTAVVVDERSAVTATVDCSAVMVVPEEAPLTAGRLGFDQPFGFEKASAAAVRFGFWHGSTLVAADAYVGELGFGTRPYPTASILLVTRRRELVLSAVEFADAQTYPNKEVVVVLHGVAEDPQLTESILGASGSVAAVRYFGADIPFGEVLDEGVLMCSGRLVAKFDDDDWYAGDHLSDLVSAWILTRADVVGKTANFAYLEESDRTLAYDDELQHRRVEHIPGGTLMAPKELLADYRFGRSTRAVDSVLLRKIRADAGQLYSTSRQGFMRRRHSGHTAGFDDDWFVRRAHGRTLPGLRLDLAGFAPEQEAESPAQVHHD